MYFIHSHVESEKTEQVNKQNRIIVIDTENKQVVARRDVVKGGIK